MFDRFEIAKALMKAFPGSFINRNGEFIAHPRSNTYFNLDNCGSILDVQCKILEWLSRSAYKTQCYVSEKSNKNFHSGMRHGINACLGTKFTEEDMDLIYEKLGNAVNHKLTIDFVNSGYDLNVLKGD